MPSFSIDPERHEMPPILMASIAAECASQLLWKAIEGSTIELDALVIYYIPDGCYVWGSGRDKERVLRDFPAVTHFKVVSLPPS
jgi:hypothetical protein